MLLDIEVERKEMNIYDLRVIAEMHFQKIVDVFKLILFLTILFRDNRFSKVLFAFR